MEQGINAVSAVESVLQKRDLQMAIDREMLRGCADIADAGRQRVAVMRCHDTKSGAPCEHLRKPALSFDRAMEDDENCGVKVRGQSGQQVAESLHPSC
jgi:hypothetical protein